MAQPQTRHIIWGRAMKYPERFNTHEEYLDWLEGFAVMGLADIDYEFDGNDSVAVETFHPEQQDFFIEIIRLARLGLERQDSLSGEKEEP